MRVRSRALPAVALLLVCLSVPAFAQHGYYREPALAGNVLVFVSEGDLWRVNTRGGIAARLTTHANPERGPAISPDGGTVAFVGSYEGTPELYTMPLTGGRPVRRTYGADRAVGVCGFAPDGRLLYVSGHRSTLPNLQLFQLDLETNRTTRLPLLEASHGAIANDGRTLFFTRFRHRQHVKRYVGGRAEQLWRFGLEGSGEAIPLTRQWAGTSHRAMPFEDRVYFISDRDGTRNVWSMDRVGRGLRQHTSHVGFDVLEASLSEGRIAYRVGAGLRLLTLENGADDPIAITLSSDLDPSRERWVEAPMDRLTSARLSHDGGQVVLTARGQSFVARTKAPVGAITALDRRNDVRYRDAMFLGSSGRIAVLSDESEEVELWSVPADGSSGRSQLTEGATILIEGSAASPDGKWMAWSDRANDLWVQQIATSGKAQVETGADGVGDLRWSHDSRWLAFTREDATGLPHIRIYEPSSRRTLVATSSRFASESPAFSPDGKWLYFLSDREFSSRVGSPWGHFQPEPYFEKSTGIFAVALAEQAIWPFDPQAADPTDDDPDPDDKSEGKDEEDQKPVAEVPLPSERGALYRVPVPADRYTWLTVTDDAVLFLTRGSGRESTLRRLAIETTGKRPVELTGSVRSVTQSGNGKRLLLRRKGELFLVPSKTKAILKDDALAKMRIDLSAWRLKFSPREDWRQIFVDSWRMHRDFFYDPGMHGVDWPAMREKYQRLIDRVGDRDELNDLIGQMIGELSALHSRAGGGDHRRAREDIANASLGAHIETDSNANGWRIVHIYRSDPERPEFRSPLARPDLGLQDGDTIHSVDGVRFDPAIAIGALMREKAGHTVRLEIRRRDGTDLECRVEAISMRTERDLRYHEWELRCRERVERAGASKIGYIHLQAMTTDDIGDWVREYAPIFERDGLIIDVRHNGGGNIDSWILNRLTRKAWFYWKSRKNRPTWNMQRSFRGHMVVLCDHATGSDGEAFAEGFRRLGLGPVIGTRTWGGEIWLSRRNRAVDGGVASAGENGVYGPGGEWLIEGHGVVPDVVIDNPPHAAFLGEDAQLDAAIQHLAKRISEDPRPVPKPPPFPDKSSKDNRKRQGAILRK